MKSCKSSKSDSEIAQIKEKIEGSRNGAFTESFRQNIPNNKNVATPVRSNRFTYKGTIDSIQLLKHKKKQMKIDFATFKKMRLQKYD